MSPRQRATGTTRSTPTMETTRRSKPVLTVFAPKAFTMLPTWFVKPNTTQLLDRLIALIDVQSLGGDMASLSHSPNGIHPLFFNETLLAHDVSSSRPPLLPSSRPTRPLVGRLAGAQSRQRTSYRRRRDSGPHGVRSVPRRNRTMGPRKHCDLYVEPRS